MTQSEKKRIEKKTNRKNVSKNKNAKSANTTSKASGKKASFYKEDLEKAKAFITDLESQLELTKQKGEDIAEKNRELKKKLFAAEYFDNLITENISTAKDGFFILLYPNQGCKILRLYKKEKPKPIKDPDNTIIINLISKYYPQLEQQAVQAQPAVFEKKEPPPTYAIPATGEEMQRLIECNIVQAGISVPFNNIQHDQPFQIHLNVDLTGVRIGGIEKDAQLDYQIFLYCKHLTGKPSKRLAEISGSIDTAKMFYEVIESEPLSLGTYRLEADANITSVKEKTKALKSFRNQYILYVD